MSIPTQTYSINNSSATNIYPYGKQTTLTLLNQGSVTVYISDYAGLSGGTPIGVGQSLGWPASSALYAYTEAGEGALLVTEGDISGQLSVSVDNPVTVQGGGEFLAKQFFSSSAAVVAKIVEIPEAPSGITYSSIALQVACLSTSAFLRWSVYDSSDMFDPIELASGIVGTPYMDTGHVMLANTGYSTTLIPLWGVGPFYVSFTLNDAANWGYNIAGASIQLDAPRSVSGGRAFKAETLELTDGGISTYEVWIPPTTEPGYIFLNSASDTLKGQISRMAPDQYSTETISFWPFETAYQIPRGSASRYLFRVNYPAINEVLKVTVSTAGGTTTRLWATNK